MLAAVNAVKFRASICGMINRPSSPILLLQPAMHAKALALLLESNTHAHMH